MRPLPLSRVFFVAGWIAAGVVACGDDPAPDPPAPEAPLSRGDASFTPDEGGARADAQGGGPGLFCASGSDIEAEPNDAPEQATPMTQLAFCGVLASADDEDYAAFTTPPGTKLGSFQAVIRGAVEFEIRVGGKTYAPSDPEALVAGSFVVKAFTKAGEPASYQFRVRFDAE